MLQCARQGEYNLPETEDRLEIPEVERGPPIESCRDIAKHNIAKENAAKCNSSEIDRGTIGAGFRQPGAYGARPFVEGICGFSGGFEGGERRARDAAGISGRERVRRGGCGAAEDFAFAGVCAGGFFSMGGAAG